MQSHHLEYWKTVSSLVKVNIAHVLTVVCLQTTINGKTLHSASSFLYKGLVGPDIQSKIQQGGDRNCQT